jgi:hypothetical protein
VKFAFWRKTTTAAVVDTPAPAPRRLDSAWIEMPLTILSWFLPSSAVVVGALGQIALAIVLLLVALGVWLRLWRGRLRRQRRT